MKGSLILLDVSSFGQYRHVVLLQDCSLDVVGTCSGFSVAVTRCSLRFFGLLRPKVMFKL